MYMKQICMCSQFPFKDMATPITCKRIWKGMAPYTIRRKEKDVSKWVNHAMPAIVFTLTVYTRYHKSCFHLGINCAIYKFLNKDMHVWWVQICSLFCWTFKKALFFQKTCRAPERLLSTLIYVQINTIISKRWKWRVLIMRWWWEHKIQTLTGRELG